MSAAEIEAGQAAATGAFAEQMRVVADPDRPGRWLADVDPRWNCPAIPQGGLMTALAAAAMTEALGQPEHRPRTLTTVFAAMVESGRVELDVTVLRRGRTMSQALVTAHGPGQDDGHTTVAVFGRERPGFEFTDLVRPDVPGPLDCPSFRDPPPEGVPEQEDPASVDERMGPQELAWWGPSTDLTVHMFEDPRSEWLLASLRARRATAGYASVESALWDERGVLVACATQVMYMHFPDGPPEGDHRIPLDQR